MSLELIPFKPIFDIWHADEPGEYVIVGGYKPGQITPLGVLYEGLRRLYIMQFHEEPSEEQLFVSFENLRDYSSISFKNHALGVKCTLLAVPVTSTAPGLRKAIDFLVNHEKFQTATYVHVPLLGVGVGGLSPQDSAGILYPALCDYLHVSIVRRPQVPPPAQVLHGLEYTSPPHDEVAQLEKALKSSVQTGKATYPTPKGVIQHLEDLAAKSPIVDAEPMKVTFKETEKAVKAWYVEEALAYTGALDLTTYPSALPISGDYGIGTAPKKK